MGLKSSLRGCSVLQPDPVPSAKGGWGWEPQSYSGLTCKRPSEHSSGWPWGGMGPPCFGGLGLLSGPPAPGEGSESQPGLLWPLSHTGPGRQAGRKNAPGKQMSLQMTLHLLTIPYKR